MSKIFLKSQNQGPPLPGYMDYSKISDMAERICRNGTVYIGKMLLFSGNHNTLFIELYVYENTWCEG